MIIDSHCHLDYLERDGILPQALERAQEAGVGAFLTIATRLERIASVRALTRLGGNIFGAIGVHPQEAAAEPLRDSQLLCAHAQAPEIVGLGETGLDFFRGTQDQVPTQERNFRLHIEAARESGLPLIIHCRDAEQAVAKILTDEAHKDARFRGVLHCFTGDAALMETALALGFYVSFSGIITFRNAKEVQNLACQVPLDRLLIETDAPFLAPVPMRGKPNEPSYLAHTLAALARLRGCAPQDLAAQTTANFLRLFSKAKLKAPQADLAKA